MKLRVLLLTLSSFPAEVMSDKIITEIWKVINREYLIKPVVSPLVHSSTATGENICTKMLKPLYPLFERNTGLTSPG